MSQPTVPEPLGNELLQLQADRARQTPSHAHEHGELLWVRRGAVVLSTAQGRWAQVPGKVGWLPPRCAHEARSFGTLTMHVLYLDAALCERLPASPAVFGTSPLATLMLEKLVVLAPAHADERRIRLLPALLDELVDTPESTQHLSLPTDARLQSLALAVLASPDDRRTLDEWALELGLSRRTLMRRFEQETGITLGHWQRQARLFAALDLLARGDSVTAAALSVGYSSVSAFIEQFRVAFGVTPARLMA